MKAGYKKTHTEKTLCEDVDYKRGATSVNGQMILPFTHSPLTRSRTIRGAYLNFYCFQFNRLSSAQCSHQSAACSQCPQAPWKQIHATFWLLLLYQIKTKCQLFSEYWGDLGNFSMIWRILQGDLCQKNTNFTWQIACYTTYNKAWLSSQAFLKSKKRRNICVRNVEVIRLL